MTNHFHRIVIVGASRGLGAAVAEHMMPQTTELIPFHALPLNTADGLKLTAFFPYRLPPVSKKFKSLP